VLAPRDERKTRRFDVIAEGLTAGFALEAVPADDVYVIRLSGALDVAACEEVISAIRVSERSGARRTVIDIAELDFIDSTGLRLLQAADRRAELTHRDVRFTRPYGYVADMLSYTALDQTLPFVDAALPA
jgi:anti-sigma B factor antagonist